MVTTVGVTVVLSWAGWGLLNQQRLNTELRAADSIAAAIRSKLAIDLQAQAGHIDVFSIMPYHARFGHATDPGWISRQIESLGRLLAVDGQAHDKNRIWPIVQLADWGETVAPEQVGAIIDHATRRPATGVMAFHWSGLSKAWPKVEALRAAYRSLR